MDHDDDLAVEQSPFFGRSPIRLVDFDRLKLHEMIAVAQRPELTVRTVPDRLREAVQRVSVETEPAVFHMRERSRLSRRVGVGDVFFRESVQTVSQNVLDAKIGKMSARMLLDRHPLLDLFHELPPKLDLLDLRRVQVRQVNPHAAADVAAHDGRGNVRLARLPNRRRPDAGSDAHVDVRRVAHIADRRNLQIVVRHFEHFGSHGAVQLLAGIYVHVPRRETDGPIVGR